VGGKDTEEKAVGVAHPPGTAAPFCPKEKEKEKEKEEEEEPRG
jgi:hypothetical protein